MNELVRILENIFIRNFKYLVEMIGDRGRIEEREIY